MCLVSRKHLTSPCTVLRFSDYFHRSFKPFLYQRGSSVEYRTLFFVVFAIVYDDDRVNYVVTVLRSKLHITD